MKRLFAFLGVFALMTFGFVVFGSNPAPAVVEQPQAEFVVSQLDYTTPTATETDIITFVDSVAELLNLPAEVATIYMSSLLILIVVFAYTGFKSWNRKRMKKYAR